MSLDQGKRVSPDDFFEKIWWQNFNRLQTWCNIGTDVENGLWAIYGARLGCYRTVLTGWDTNQISDYEWFKDYFYNDVIKQFPGDESCKYTKVDWSKELLYNKVCEVGKELNEGISNMMLFDPNEQVCKFFKKTYVNPRRWGVMIREKQIQELLEKGLLQ